MSVIMKTFALVAVSGLLLSCGSIQAGAPEKSSGIMLSDLHKYMNQASEISMNHIPNSSIGTRLRVRRNILTDWKYRMTLNCSKSCGERKSSYLLDIAEQASRQADDCPVPLNTAIILSREGTPIWTIYVHQSGHCFSVDGQAYYSKLKLTPLMDFVKF